MYKLQNNHQIIPLMNKYLIVFLFCIFSTNLFTKESPQLVGPGGRRLRDEPRGGLGRGRRALQARERRTRLGGLGRRARLLQRALDPHLPTHVRSSRARARRRRVVARFASRRVALSSLCRRSLSNEISTALNSVLHPQHTISACGKHVGLHTPID